MFFSQGANWIFLKVPEMNFSDILEQEKSNNFAISALLEIISVRNTRLG